MIQFFKDVNFDWLGRRRIFLGLSVLLMLAGLGSAIIRQATPGGTDAFNLGVDFKGGTVVTVQFRQRPQSEAIRDALSKQGVKDSVIQPITDKADQHLIKVPRQVASDESLEDVQAQVDAGRTRVKHALDSFGTETRTDLVSDQQAAYKILSTDAVGEIAGKQLRNSALAVTLAALLGMLAYIGFRFEWTYGAAAVITVFHDVLVTLGIFSIMQWEVSLTVIAALLTLVGFSVNDTIVTFDRIRENLRLHRRETLYKITNDSINQTLSRTVITSGLVFLSVLAMVIFGGEVLRGFSLALLIGIVVGTYSTIAIASPIMVWWQQRIEAANRAMLVAATQKGTPPSQSGGARSSKSGQIVGEPSRAGRG